MHTAVLDELEEGTRAEQIRQAKAQLNAAESRMKNAQDEFNRYNQLYKEGAVSGSTFDTRDTALKVATEEYNNALEHFSEFEKGPQRTANSCGDTPTGEGDLGTQKD